MDPPTFPLRRAGTILVTHCKVANRGKIQFFTALNEVHKYQLRHGYPRATVDHMKPYLNEVRLINGQLNYKFLLCRPNDFGFANPHEILAAKIRSNQAGSPIHRVCKNTQHIYNT